VNAFVGAGKHVKETLAKDGSWMIVEPFAHDNLKDNLNPVGCIFYHASTFLCTPASLSQEVGNWMMAKYDAVNPLTFKKRLAGGTKLHGFSPAIMEASYKATKELNSEVTATNPNFKKIYESVSSFTSTGYQWSRSRKSVSTASWHVTP
jgi:hypothetical protein